ncbi:nitrous oxide-stimulated promoter family protein [Shewanella cyperi]|uniref:Nitrous oxide-stimulated promoter family protein n=1 Tax=Shewanella cyperi TaxID=2814292 RepID=A0A974XM67_9GAMM|nr:nitrous oxide-stimulated promoter family protein [Shewanella cyperi]QSX29833.1 nitrous oxide-stimulated promoter family protein [Shewanella cyperi]QSX40617.1 nitrous oxide-stimulated promoter family protein [Shewanella cyperi]
MASDIILLGGLQQEFATIEAMVKLYCRAHHKSTSAACPCPDCIEFLDYAREKLDRCPYGEKKPACNRCPIHCYKPEQRQQAKTIMRFAGPRMLLAHPLLAIRHLRLERRPVPDLPQENVSNRQRRKQFSNN